MTRTHSKHVRVYANGVDISGYSRNVGVLSWEFEAQPDAAYTDECKNILPGVANIQAGPINAFLDNDAAGLFNLMSAGGLVTDLMLPIGINAAPAAGDPVFAWEFAELAYIAGDGGAFVNANIGLSPSYCLAPIAYNKPWGYLLHAKAARTAVNTAAGIDDYGAATALGGVFCYQLFSSDGTVTLKAQDASINSDANFADLTGATSGSITAAASPKFGMVALTATQAVKRYLRWQIVLGTATTATFALSFIRRI